MSRIGPAIAPAQEPVAIVGIGCRFPGGVIDPASFWRLLIEETDAITEIPTDRIDVDHYFDPKPATPGRMMTRYGGFLDHLQEFDAAFFGISPREAQSVDPQQRVLLETAWEALEDAGANVHQLEGSRTAVFVGQWVSDFEARLFADPEAVDFAMTTGSGRYASSGRISYVFGFRGPSFTIDSACSSSLAAVHLGVRSIRSGEADLALAGGVNIILQPQISIGYSQSRMMAADGRCKFGDASGDGYVRSEGAGLVVLKGLARAIADGDRIYAVVRGSAVNNDGRSSGVLGRPSQVGHEEMLRAAYSDAGVSPARVGYVEAHGTGTRAGDPVELAALAAVLAADRPVDAACLIGSVKTNVGHTESAAGIAGLIKAALALHHAVVPASLHFVQPNPRVPWADLPFRIPTAASPWPPSTEPRVAGVNSFGISGTNAHAVLEQAPTFPLTGVSPSVPAAALLPLSAKSPDALRTLAERYAALLENNSAGDAHDIYWSTATRRTPLEHRAVFVAPDRALMVEALRGFAAGAAPVAEGIVRSEARPRVAFVCPGQGAQWIGMARELAAHEPVFLDALTACDAAMKPYGDWSIVAQLHADPGAPDYRLDQIDVIQPVLVALAIAYARVWRARGVEPDAVVGHSMGEVAAAHIAGALDLDQAMRIICLRSALMRRTSGRGAMALVDLSMENAQARLAGLEDRVTVAVSNSPRSSVISGEPEAVHQLLLELEREGVFCRPIKVDVASHSPQMDALSVQLGEALDALVSTDATCPIYSTVLARRADGVEFSRGYWARNLRQPVRFGQTVSQMLADGITVFVELGPHPVLLPSNQQTAAAEGRDAATIAVARKEEGERAAFHAAIGALWAAGYPIDWRKVLPASGRVVDLPLYPWQRQRHWADAAEMAPVGRGSLAVTAKPDAASLEWLYQLHWKSVASATPAQIPEASRWLVVSDDDESASAVVAAGLAVGVRSIAARFDNAAAAIMRESPTLIVVLAGERDTAYAPVRVLQSVLAAPHVRARVWFATRGGQAVLSQPLERVSIPQAALWGSARVIAEEHPEYWGGLVDLDPRLGWADDASALVAQLMASDNEDQVAVRGDQRFVLRLIAAQEHRPANGFAWRTDAAYLITGGLGEVGLHIARTMAAHGVRRLILIGRTALPPREQWADLDPRHPMAARVQAVRALETSGVAVHVASLDVSDEAQLRAFLERYVNEGWPPIRGVVHAAGELRNQLAGEMTPAVFDAVVRPKVEGARLLDRLLPDVDLFVLFSSTGAFLAQPGQANYAAANAGLDAVAHDRRARGLSAHSIGWGVWENTGLVKGDAGERNVSGMARQGIGAFAPAQGAALFAWLCTRSTASVAVLPIEWSVFARSRSGRRGELFSDIQGASAADVSTSDVATTLLGADSQRRRQILHGVVRQTVGRVLKIAPAQLDARKALGAMGLNSLMAMELHNRLETAVGRPLPATLAWNHPTVDALVEYLAGSGPEQPRHEAERVVAEPRPGDAVSHVAALSDDEAALALRARL
jgi:phthiocerol/phenolphthiocerol synthesis type-I polyketide synthase B